MFRSVRCDNVEITEPLVSPERMMSVLEEVVRMNRLIVEFVCNRAFVKLSETTTDEERASDSAA